MLRKYALYSKEDTENRTIVQGDEDFDKGFQFRCLQGSGK